MEIVEYRDQDKEQVVDLIISIQQNEFGINITADDQPDLSEIPLLYQEKNGNFWVARTGDKIIGTIALVDIGNSEVGLRKMFVHPEYRGKEKGIAQALMNRVIEWCKEKQVRTIYLGTINIMKAAHRFYEKNGFSAIARGELPPAFMQMKVDNVFYKLILAS